MDFQLPKLDLTIPQLPNVQLPGNQIPDFNLFSNQPQTNTLPTMSSGSSVFGSDILNSTIANYNNINSLFDISGAMNNLMADVPSIMSNARNASASNNTQQQPQINTNNFADCFDKLGTENINKLKEMEQNIQEKEAAYKNAATKEEKAAIAKELNKLKSNYRKLERSISPSAQPSKAYNKEFNFYSNLDDEEISAITEENQEINRLKEEAQDLQKQVLEAKQNLATKMQQIQSSGGNPNTALSGISQEEQDAIKNLEAQYNSTLEEISDKIANLGKYIKSAGKDNNSVNFDIHTYESDSSNKASSGSSSSQTRAKTQVASAIANSMYKQDGTLVDNPEQAIKESISNLNNDNIPYSSDVIDQVSEFIAEQAAKSDNKKAFINSIKTTDFLETIAKDSRFKPDKNNSSEAMSLLTKVCDSLLGGNGRFKEIAKNAQSGTPAAGTNNRIKAGENYDTQQKTAKAQSSDNAQSTKTDNAEIKYEDLSSDKEKFEYLEKNSEYAKKYYADNKDNMKNFDKVILSYLIDQGEIKDFEKMSDENQGWLSIQLNEMAEQSGIDGRLYIDENWSDTVEYDSQATIAEKKENDKNDIWTIGNDMGGGYDAEEIGDEINFDDGADKLSAIARDIIKSLKNHQEE